MLVSPPSVRDEHTADTWSCRDDLSEALELSSEFDTVNLAPGSSRTLACRVRHRHFSFGASSIPSIAIIQLSFRRVSCTITSAAMARGSQNEASTPRPPPTLKKSTSTASSTGKGKQQSIAGFFQKRTAPQASTPAKRAADSSVPKSVEASSTIGPGSSPRTAPGASQSSAVNGSGKENGE